jgi:hypothetical protein
MIGQAPRVRLPLRERREVLDEEDRQGVARTEKRGAPAQSWPSSVRRPPSRISPTSTPRALHRGHVGNQVVALQGHDPEPAALVRYSARLASGLPGTTAPRSRMLRISR